MSKYIDQVDVFTSRFADILLDASRNANSAEVLSILKSSPTTACADGLAASIMEVAEKHPEAADALANLVQVVLDSVIDIPVEDYWERPVHLHTVVLDSLAESIKDSLDETQYTIPKQTTISPSNPTIAVALFASSAIKSGFLNENISRAPYLFTLQGLQLPGSRFDAPDEVQRQETVGIGACLLLTIAGASVTQAFSPHEKELALEALKELKEKHVISYPGGIALLEDAIANAESAYTHDMPALQAWNRLFPETIQFTDL
ncbi:hypothetical protein Hypma_012937 [Hypsizygus marmoreus]|uniref:Uncharacterized protein n=1 Tax=Hypsizygus marmoreus TaxID=39966 RepID=A0A369JN16_HYPMA|nr:hypothetical protein Hypma_012937 [Hypsizygus marmoreus]